MNNSNTNDLIKVKVNAPSDVATKRLKITQYSNGEKRKIQISSNLLELFKFPKGAKVIEESRGEGMGYTVRLAEPSDIFNRTKRIYSRTYKRLSSNPFELTYESTAKRILESIPKTCTHVHLIMTHGKMYITPVANLVAERIAKLLNAKDPLSIFSCCSSGVDGHAAASEGFTVNSQLEFRPMEARDKGKDYTESGILTALSNLDIKHVFNENIEQVDTRMLEHLTRKDQSSLFTISLACDDFSLAKSPSLKEASFNDATSTIDMLYDGLRIIEALKFPMVLLEQVEGFHRSEISKLWDLRLRKWGYKVYSKVIDARDQGGLSSRRRFFSFATTLPNLFEFPEDLPRSTISVWDKVKDEFFQGMRQVSHSKSIQDGASTGRLRTFNRESLSCPTLMRCQQRMTKDSVVLDLDGEYYMTSLEMEKELMGIPQSFDLNATTKGLGSEIICQAVDYLNYKRIIRKVKEHVNDFLIGSYCTAV